LAFGTNDPEGSATLPEKLVVGADCAEAEAARSIGTIRSARFGWRACNIEGILNDTSIQVAL
jgi:hypothetical protein